MLVEHTFVTTRDEGSTLSRAEQYLRLLGYRYVPGGGEAELTMTRGGTQVNARVAFDDLPQSVYLQYDRGRVVVAASIHEYRKVDHLHRGLMVGVVAGLEQVLVRNAAFEDARIDFDTVSRQIDEEFRRRRRKRTHAIGCLVAVVVALFVLMVIGIINS